MRADAPSCCCGDPGDLAASAHPRGSLQASGAGTVPGAPHSAPAPARHSKLLRHCGGSGLAPSRSRPSASGECAGRCAKRWEPSAAEAGPPPAPNPVGGRCVWKLALWRTRFSANFGGRLRGGVGERRRRRRHRGVATASSSGPQLSRSVHKWEVGPFAWRTLGRRGRLGSADAVRWAGGRHFPRS